MTERREPNVRTQRNPRRRPGASDTVVEPDAVAEPKPAAEVVRAAVVTAPRVVATDLSGLEGIADLDRATLDAMLAEFGPRKGGGRVHAGQRVRGPVTRITESAVFVDVGSKADAVLDRVDAPTTLAVGDTFDAWVHSIRDGEVRLTTRPSGDSAREMYREAQARKEPVTGRVTAVGEHGLDVDLGDGVRGFCPTSQIDRGDVDPMELLGSSQRFRVSNTTGRDILLSRRAVQDDEARTADDAKLKTLREGDVLEGTVTSLREFGAFVKLPDGVEGLVHLSNLSKKRVQNPAEVVAEGQVVKVRVLSVDLDRRRVNLGMRQAEDAPVQERAAAAPRGFNLFEGLLQNVKVKK